MNVNPPKVQKDIQTQIEATNLGTNKTIINVNGKVANIKTNLNSKITYNMKDPIKLNKGDKITLYQAFLNEKGLNVDTISFQEDIETELRFLYYRQGELGDVLTSQDDLSYCNYPAVNPDCINSKIPLQTKGVIPDANNDLTDFEDLIGAAWGPNAGDISKKGNFGKQTDLNGGAKGNIFYLFENVLFNATPTKNAPYDNYQFKYRSHPPEGLPQNTLSNINPNYIGNVDDGAINTPLYDPPRFQRPVYGKQKIVIPAGNYSVDAVAELVMEQMNGSKGAVGQPFSKQSNALLDNLYRPEVSKGKKLFGNMTKGTLPYYRYITNNVENSDDEILEHDDIFWKRGFENQSTRTNGGTLVALNSSHISYYDDIYAITCVSSYHNDYDKTGEDPLLNQVPTGFNYQFFADSQSDFILEGSPYETHFQHLFANGSHTYWSDTFLDTWDRQAQQGFFYDTKHLFGLKYKYDQPRKPLIGGDNLQASNGYVAPLRDVMEMEFLIPVMGKTNPAGSMAKPLRGPVQRFAGTSAFNIQFKASNKNRFSFSNLHEPYKVPNYQQDGTSNKAGGQTATMYNNPYAQASQNTFMIDAYNGTVYPIDCQAGIMVNNFAYEECKKTDVWKNLKAQILTYTEFGSTDGYRYGVNAVKREALIYELFTKPYDQFFATEEDARNSWANTLWSRMGFSYDQLGNITDLLETRSVGCSNFRQRELKLKGLITHNYFDFTSIPASQGLGKSSVAALTQHGQPLQKYKLADYYKGNTLKDNFGLGMNNFVLLEDSNFIDADDLPDLNNGNSYYIIESDIVKPNYMNATATHGTVVGFMTKQEASNDTLYSTEGIEFTMTEDKLLSEINLEIKNPDGTRVPDPILGKNSGFIFIVEKAINPETMALNSF